MARHVLLNNVDHKALRIITTRSAEYGDDVMYALTFPAEFPSIQSYYPIVFRKRGDTGQFEPVALFGFEEGENLFLGEGGWEAHYVPLSIERQPFLIGFQNAPTPGAGPEMVMHVDLDSPRVSYTEGEPVFREYGGTTEYLDRVNSVLKALHDGLAATPAFVEALLQHELLESFVLDVGQPDGSQRRLAGFYTVNQERLRGLDGAAIAALHAAGHLEPAYMVLASIAHFRDLIERRNRRASGDRP
jgi:hypothetical protein